MSLSLKKADILNPKKGNTSYNNRANWYDYYAGYSPKFALQILSSVGVKAKSTVLDPWNGIGTTTLAASALGVPAIGYDLNPVPVIVAKALILSTGEKQSIKPLLKEIIAKSSKFASGEVEPFLTWFDKDTCSHLRGIEKAVQFLLVEGSEEDRFILDDIEKVSEMASFFYVALFRTLRILVDEFIGSNPTWVKKAKDNHLSFGRKIITSLFEGEVEKMLSDFEPIFSNRKWINPSLGIGDSMNILADECAVDFLLTSPPYCTRIDYGVYTMPELAVLGYDTKSNWSSLRSSLIGTTTVPEKSPAFDEQWGTTCSEFVEELMNHTSKASQSYYLKNHLQYFEMMFKSVKEISRVLKNGGGCALVVQDSYYKEIHNNLPNIVAEMAANNGLNLFSKTNFKSVTNMAAVNPGTKKYRPQAEATESVLLFNK